MSKFCVIGHLTLDHIIRKSSVKKCMGGTAYYSSVTAKLLGWNSTLISKVGFDFPMEYLRDIELLGVDTSRIQRMDSPSTSFMLKYNGGRILKLISRCDEIYVDDVYNAIDDSTVVHLGPVAGEISLDVIDFVYENSKITSTDLQGFLRFFGFQGFVELVKPIFIDDILTCVDVIHCDLNEAYVCTGIKDPIKAAESLCSDYDLIVLLTIGEGGSYIAYDDSIFHIPSPVKHVVEETGAGDIYTAAFLFMYDFIDDPLKSAIFASSVTSIYIESGNILEIANKIKINTKMDSLKSLIKII